MKSGRDLPPRFRNFSIFISEVIEDLEEFVNTPEDDDHRSVFLFPTLNDHFRYLIHWIVDQNFSPDYVSFSIGSEKSSRVVVCKPTLLKKSIAEIQQRRAAMAEPKKRDRFSRKSSAPAQIYVPPPARRSLTAEESQRSNSRSVGTTRPRKMCEDSGLLFEKVERSEYERDQMERAQRKVKTVPKTVQARLQPQSCSDDVGYISTQVFVSSKYNQREEAEASGKELLKKYASGMDSTSKLVVVETTAEEPTVGVTPVAKTEVLDCASPNHANDGNAIVMGLLEEIFRSAVGAGTVMEMTGETAVAETTAEEPAVGETPVAETTGEEPAIGETPVAETTGEEPAVGETPVAETTGEEPAVGETPVAETTAEEPAVGETPVAETTEEEPGIGETLVAETTAEEPAVGETAVAETTAEEPAVGETPVAETTGEEPAVGENPVAETELDCASPNHANDGYAIVIGLLEEIFRSAVGAGTVVEMTGGTAEEARGESVPKDSSEMSGACSTLVTPKEEGIDSNDWESLYDDNGECLRPELIQELADIVGTVKIVTPSQTYKHHQSNEDRESDGESIVEIYNIPQNFKTEDVMKIFSAYAQKGFYVKWVDESHALGVFSSPLLADEVLERPFPIVKIRPLSKGLPESRMKARTIKIPVALRPKTCVSLAKRLVSGALGLRVDISKADRDAERKMLKEAREQRRLAARQRKEAWEGTLASTQSEEQKPKE